MRSRKRLRPLRSRERVSAALTGYPQAGSGDGRESHACVATPQRAASLRALVAVVASTPASELDAAIAARKLDKVANELVAAWYSGMVGPQGRPLHGCARVDGDGVLEADGHLRRRDRLLGRPVDADVAIVGAPASRGAMIASRLAVAGAKVVVTGSGTACAARRRGHAVHDAAIKVPECAYPNAAVCAASALGQPRQLLRAGRAADNSRAPTCARSAAPRGTGSAPACASCRTISGCDEIRPRRRLADRLRRRSSRGTAQAESEIGVSGDSGQDLGSPRSAPYPMPAIPQTYLDKHIGQAFAGTPFEVRSDAAGTQFGRARRSRAVLRQRQLHSDLSDPGQVRRDRARRARGGRRRASHGAAVVVLRRGRRRTAGSRRIRYKRPDGSERRASRPRSS